MIGYEMFRNLVLRSKKGKKNMGQQQQQQQHPQPGSQQQPTVVDLEAESDAEANGDGAPAAASAADNWTMHQMLLDPGPDVVICDEGHRIKNSKSNVAMVLKDIRTMRRVVLTGSPLQNNLDEYWCMIDFVRPNYLGSLSDFHNQFVHPIMNGQCSDSNPGDVKLMKYRVYVLHQHLQGFVQRRTHNVLKDALPPKYEYVISLRLTPVQEALYKRLLASSSSALHSGNLFAVYTTASKICNHPDVLYNAYNKAVKYTAQQAEHHRAQQTEPHRVHVVPLPELSLEEAQSSAGRRFPTLSYASPAEFGSHHGLASAKSYPCSAAATGPSAVCPGGSKAASESGQPVATQHTGRQPTGESTTQSSGKMQHSHWFDTQVRDEKHDYTWARPIFEGRYSPGDVNAGSKMQLFLEIADACVLGGEKLLVFTQHLATLNLIEHTLAQRFIPLVTKKKEMQKWIPRKSYYRIDGRVSGAERQQLINSFNDPVNKDTHLFLLSTRAGSLGINLVGASRVIVFDAAWNPAHDSQAVCRIFRFGQTKPCHIYRLIAAGEFCACCP